MGTPDFAVPTLDAIVAAGHEVVGVVARPDQPSGRGHKLQSPPTVLRARELGLVVKQPKAVRSGPFPEWVEACGADVGVVIAYGRILTPRLLGAPRRGCINVHASLLPRHRGAAPIHWAVIEGDAESGVCTMQMDEGLDTGDVLLEARTSVGPDETAGELWDRLAAMGASLLVETLDRLGEIVPQPQDHARATLAPPLTKETGRLDFGWSAQRVHDRVRGTNPWPGATAIFRGELLKIHRTAVVPGSGAPGEIAIVGGRPIVACGEGAVELLEVQLPGRKRVDGRSFVNGTRVEAGERL